LIRSGSSDTAKTTEHSVASTTKDTISSTTKYAVAAADQSVSTAEQAIAAAEEPLLETESVQSKVQVKTQVDEVASVLSDVSESSVVPAWCPVDQVAQHGSLGVDGNVGVNVQERASPVLQVAKVAVSPAWDSVVPNWGEAGFLHDRKVGIDIGLRGVSICSKCWDQNLATYKDTPGVLEVAESTSLIARSAIGKLGRAAKETTASEQTATVASQKSTVAEEATVTTEKTAVAEDSLGQSDVQVQLVPMISTKSEDMGADLLRHRGRRPCSRTCC
jgi:hypothetical protein